MIRIKLKAVLAEKGIKQKDLVAMTVLDCQPADLLEFVPDENEKSPDA